MLSLNDRTNACQIDQIPARLRPAVLGIQHLQTVDRYLAAYIFGSVARDESTAASDLDVHVLVASGDACANINHPIINGTKLDLTFLSFEQLSVRTQREIEKGTRVPMVAESVIVFDKTGALTRLRTSAREARPKACTPGDYHGIQQSIRHVNDKAGRLLTTDPAGALLVMHISLNDVLKAHYQIHSRWQVSDKRLLADLRTWDPTLAGLVERLVGTADVVAKFTIWTDIIDHVMAPIGGWQTIAGCSCDACQRDLTMLANI